MASNREQEHNSGINFSIFKSEPTQTKRSDVKQISLEGDLKRQESSPACLLSPTIDYNSQRRSSAPTIDRPVGSNKFFIPTKKRNSIFDNRKSPNLKRK